jgi:hypothetical protein
MMSWTVALSYSALRSSSLGECAAAAMSMVRNRGWDLLVYECLGSIVACQAIDPDSNFDLGEVLVLFPQQFEKIR